MAFGRQSAVTMLEDRLERNPAAQAFARLADTYRQRGDLDDAVRVCKDGLARNENYAAGRTVLGRCYYEQEKFAEALAEFGRICVVDRRHLVALKMMADIFLRQGRSDKAGDVYAYLALVDPGSDSLARLAGQYPGGGLGITEILGTVVAAEVTREIRRPPVSDPTQELTATVIESAFAVPQSQHLGDDVELMPAHQEVLPDLVPEQSTSSLEAVSGEDVSDRLRSMFGEEPREPDMSVVESAAPQEPKSEISPASLDDIQSAETMEFSGSILAAAMENAMPAPEEVASRIDELFGAGNAPTEAFERAATVPQEPALAERAQLDDIDIDLVNAPTMALPGDLALTADPAGLSGDDVTLRIEEMFSQETTDLPAGAGVAGISAPAAEELLPQMPTTDDIARAQTVMLDRSVLGSELPGRAPASGEMLDVAQVVDDANFTGDDVGARIDQIFGGAETDDDESSDPFVDIAASSPRGETSRGEEVPDLPPANVQTPGSVDSLDESALPSDPGVSAIAGEASARTAPEPFDESAMLPARSSDNGSEETSTFTIDEVVDESAPGLRPGQSVSEEDGAVAERIEIPTGQDIAEQLDFVFEEGPETPVLDSESPQPADNTVTHDIHAATRDEETIDHAVPRVAAGDVDAVINGTDVEQRLDTMFKEDQLFAGDDQVSAPREDEGTATSDILGSAGHDVAAQLGSVFGDGPEAPVPESESPQPADNAVTHDIQATARDEEAIDSVVPQVTAGKADEVINGTDVEQRLDTMFKEDQLFPGEDQVSAPREDEGTATFDIPGSTGHDVAAQLGSVFEQVPETPVNSQPADNTVAHDIHAVTRDEETVDHAAPKLTEGEIDALSATSGTGVAQLLDSMLNEVPLFPGDDKTSARREDEGTATFDIPGSTGHDVAAQLGSVFDNGPEAPVLESESPQPADNTVTHDIHAASLDIETIDHVVPQVTAAQTDEVISGSDVAQRLDTMFKEDQLFAGDDQTPAREDEGMEFLTAAKESAVATTAVSTSEEDEADRVAAGLVDKKPSAISSSEDPFVDRGDVDTVVYAPESRTEDHDEAETIEHPSPAPAILDAGPSGQASGNADEDRPQDRRGVETSENFSPASFLLGDEALGQDSEYEDPFVDRGDSDTAAYTPASLARDHSDVETVAHPSPAHQSLHDETVAGDSEYSDEDRSQVYAIPDHVLTPTLADIYYQQGQPQLAIQIYERILERDGDNDALRDRLEQIRAAAAQGTGAIDVRNVSSFESEAPSAPAPREMGAPRTQHIRAARKAAAKKPKPLEGVRINRRIRDRLKKSRQKP